MNRRDAARARSYLVLALVGVALLWFLAALVGCASANAAPASAARAPTYAVLIVQNDGLPDEHVWVAAPGGHGRLTGRKLGIVAGFRADTFRLRPSDVAPDGDVYLVAVAFPGPLSYSRGLPITAGTVWQWTIGQPLPNSDGAVPLRMAGP